MTELEQLRAELDKEKAKRRQLELELLDLVRKILYPEK